MYQKTLTIFLVLVALLSIGSGITGFYSLEDTAGYCFSNVDCSYSVCCPVYGEVYGVCAQESECSGILTASESKIDSIVRPAASLEDQASQSYVAISLGLIILMIIAIVSYVEWHQHDAIPAKKRKKKKKAKK